MTTKMQLPGPEPERLWEEIRELKKRNRLLVILCSAALLFTWIGMGLLLSGLISRNVGVIKAREFIVVGQDGVVRARLSANQDTSGLTLSGGGKSRATLTVGNGEPNLVMTDSDGEVRVHVGYWPTLKTARLALSAQEGAVEFGVSPLGTEIDLKDARGDSHASLSYMRLGPSLSLGDEQVEDQGIMTGNGIGFWTDKGTMIWHAGR
jgi:hypothetical protein